MLKMAVMVRYLEVQYLVNPVSSVQQDLLDHKEPQARKDHEDPKVNLESKERTEIKDRLDCKDQVRF